VTTLTVEPLTAESFAPFGTIIAAPEREPDALGSGWRWWGEETLIPGDDRAWGVGHLFLEPVPPTFSWAERHMRSKEVVIALTTDLLLYVAPPLYPEEPGRLPPLDDFRVYQVPWKKGVVLNEGVWHGAPFTVEQPGAALVLLKEGTGREDVTKVSFDDSPVRVVEEAVRKSTSQATSRAER
jgi:ureidoglycolate lyase